VVFVVVSALTVVVAGLIVVVDFTKLNRSSLRAIKQNM